MSSAPLLIEKKNKIATIMLNRPRVMNAMSKEMILALHDAVKEIALDEDIHVVVLKGAGDHFCSGADIGLFAEDIASYAWLTAMKGVGQIVRTLREMPQPVIPCSKGWPSAAAPTWLWRPTSSSRRILPGFVKFSSTSV